MLLGAMMRTMRKPSVVAMMVLTVVLAGCSSSQTVPPTTQHGLPTSTSTTTITVPPSSTARGLVIPATYQAACANEGTAVCRSEGGVGSIPVSLRRHLHFPKLRTGARCPATRGHLIGKNPVLGGYEYGNSPVAVLIANGGNFRRGVIDLGASDVPGWLAFKTIWVSVPSYKGPFSIRAMRLDGPG